MIHITFSLIIEFTNNMYSVTRCYHTIKPVKSIYQIFIQNPNSKIKKKKSNKFPILCSKNKIYTTHLTNKQTVLLHIAHSVALKPENNNILIYYNRFIIQWITNLQKDIF